MKGVLFNKNVMVSRLKDASLDLGVQALDSTPRILADKFAHWSSPLGVQVTSIPALPPGRLLLEIKLRFQESVHIRPGKAPRYYAKRTGINVRHAPEVAAAICRPGTFLGIVQNYRRQRPNRNRSAADATHQGTVVDERGGG
jgi:hypothetical protein